MLQITQLEARGAVMGLLTPGPYGTGDIGLARVTCLLGSS